MYNISESNLGECVKIGYNGKNLDELSMDIHEAAVIDCSEWFETGGTFRTMSKGFKKSCCSCSCALQDITQGIKKDRAYKIREKDWKRIYPEKNYPYTAYRGMDEPKTEEDEIYYQNFIERLIKRQNK